MLNVLGTPAAPNTFGRQIPVEMDEALVLVVSIGLRSSLPPGR